MDEQGNPDENRQRYYALLILAEPVTDPQITQLMSTYMTLQGEIHRCVDLNISSSANRGESASVFLSRSPAGRIAAARRVEGRGKAGDGSVSG